jgi:carbon-monoxide dehydrogenase medium subunit
MKPAPFEYVRAGSLDEALAALAEYGDEARVLAGGQSLVPMMNLRLARPAVLVDVNRLGLTGIEVDEGRISVGALVHHADLLSDPAVAAAAPVIGEAVIHIAHPTIRRRGTAGGSVAHADPTAELAGLLLLLDGDIEARSASATRRIAAGDFFKGAFTTSLDVGEMITRIGFDLPRGKWGACFHEIAERRGDFAIAAVGARLSLENGRIEDVRLVLQGAGSVPLRAFGAESDLNGQTMTDDLVAAAGRTATDGLACHDDVRATADYRRELLAVLAADAIRTAYHRAEAAPQ